MRCANTEALERYEREVAKAEERHESRLLAMCEELDDHIEAMKALLREYDMITEGEEYIKDTL